MTKESKTDKLVAQLLAQIITQQQKQVDALVVLEHEFPVEVIIMAAAMSHWLISVKEVNKGELSFELVQPKKEDKK